MELGSKFVYLGNADEDEEEVDVLADRVIVLSDSESGGEDDGETCVLDILDTAGQEEYSSMKDQYVRDGDGFVIVYSITDATSFAEAETIYKWLERVKSEKPKVILVANKQDIDTDIAVTTDQGQALAQKLGVPLFPTSAKTGQGVRDAMEGLVREIPRASKDYQIVMLGAGAVGKSSVTIRFVSDTFVDDYDPTIEDSYRKMIQVKDLRALDKGDRKALKQKKKMLRKGGAAPDLSRDSLFMGGARQRSAPASARAMRQAPPMKGGDGIVSSLKSACGSVSSQCKWQNQNANAKPPPPPPPPLPTPRMAMGASRSFGFGGAQCMRLNRYANEIPPPMPPSRLKPTMAMGTSVSNEASKKKMKTRKTDGNVVLIPLRDLSNEPNLVTGDAVTCQQCQAVLTSTAKLEPQAEGGKCSWTCEFCGYVNNNLEISEDEIPKGDSIDFMLAPPTVTESTEEKKKVTTAGTTVYCMDVSSSMSALCQLPESQVAWRQERSGGSAASSITRLECIKTAVLRLAEQLQLEEPEKKVLLIVFGSKVIIKAGGNTSWRIPNIPDVDRSTMQQLLDIGLELNNTYPLSVIEESYSAIEPTVRALQTSGCTALGPALAISVGYVSKTPSSEVVLCTDGEPNVGIGGSNRNDGFYHDIGTYARDKNVTINILAMEGASTDLARVSAAAEQSGGTTNKLNPAELVRQLRTIAQNEAVAYSVTVTFFLHPDFVFDEPGFPDNLSRLEKEVGPVRKDTDMSFRFKLKDPSKAGSIGSVPFQVQINYTRQSDGMKCLRVLSKRTEATTDRKSMEENVNVAVMGVAAMKSPAMLAAAGQAIQAQHQLKNVKRMVKRGAKSSEQEEERVAFQIQALTWDDELTDRNEVYLQPHSDDFATKNIRQACSTNARQQQAVFKKMAHVKERKMKAQTRDAYYAYHDD